MVVDIKGVFSKPIEYTRKTHMLISTEKHTLWNHSTQLQIQILPMFREKKPTSSTANDFINSNSNAT